MRLTRRARTLIVFAAFLPFWARVPGPLENTTMSASAATPSQSSEVASALADYDKSHRPEDLRRAADAASREDGNPPADPAVAPAEARQRVGLWVDILSRFRRDLDPDFDPDNPPSQAVQAPVVHGRRIMPLQKPADLQDPEERAALEQAIADRNARVARFEAMANIREIHDAILDQARESLLDARDVLGYPAADIDAALAGADISPADRDSLRTAISN